MHLRKSLSFPQWVKLGNIREFTCVGKETIAVGCGCHILFYSLEGNVENIYIANSKERGDGVSCITGHQTAPIFAIAEKCLNPRILVFSYPAIDGPVSVLKGGAMGSYMSMAFSDMEFLVALSGAPQFSITVWSWRTGIQLVSRETEIYNPSQQLSLCSPAIISHIVKGESRLQFWEINVCAKLCCLSNQEVELPKHVIPVNVCFTNEGDLLFVDSLGDVYQVDFEENKAVRHTWYSSPGDGIVTEVDGILESSCNSISEHLDRRLDPCMTFFKTGVVVFQPPLKLRVYKRLAEGSYAWSVDVSHPLCHLIYLPDPDLVVGWTTKSELILVDCTKNAKLSVLKYYGNNIIDMELIYPDGNTVVTMNTSDEVQVWSKESGQLMGVYDVRDVAVQSNRPVASFVSLKANPHYPYVAVALSSGLLLLVSILYPTAPVTLTKFLLCDEEISLVCFAPAGDVFVAATSTTGRVFLIQGVPGQEMRIVTSLDLKISIVDCTLLPDEQPLLAILFAQDAHSSVGNHIALYALELDGLHLDTETELEHIYTKLVVNTMSKNTCFGSVYCSRNIHLLEMKRKSGVTLKAIELTGHQIRSVCMSERIEYGLLTYGVDGMVIARPTGSKQQFYIILPHHRADSGVMKAFQDPKGEFVISLGKDRSLVCSKLKRTAKYTPESLEPSSEMIEKFQEPTTGFFLDGENFGTNWLQYQEKLRIAGEEQETAHERTKIIEDFKKLQEKVVEMLNANENAPQEEQLPISTFDLDKDARESAMEEGRQFREKLKANTIAKIAVLEKKSALIKESCWDPVIVKPTCVESLQWNYRVENYPLMPEKEEDEHGLKMVIERRKIEMKAATTDSLHPWESKTNSELAMHVTSAPGSITLLDETTRMKQALAQDQGSSPGESVEQEQRESQYVMCGSSIYHYIQPSPYHISQFELNTYFQTAQSIVLLQKDIRNLQEWFNNQFQLLYQAKHKELNTIKTLHKRMRHIFKELLLTCSVEHTDPDPIDPEWSQYEKPELMLTVEDNEVSVKPYISPSEQALLWQKAEEEERVRLLLLADNFRELALIKMMDGVLEIKWEDLLKRDIPKPRCMIEKEPEDFNEDDLREVKVYEEQVQFRINERQHYQKRLDTDFKKVKRTLKDSLCKYEERLLDFFNLKLRVEASCVQQTLRVLRSQLLNPKRNALAQKEDAARNAITSNQKALADEQQLVAQLQEAVADCRSAFEAQLAKEKSFDSKFKKEFPELSPMVAEVALRLYKRRPKTHPKILASATLMNELGRFAVACKKPPYLPPECLEYLKGIDFLDNAVNAPSNMNPNTWVNVCRLRRQKIESEFKIKVLALQISEADNTITVYQKNVKALKEKDKELQGTLRAIQEQQLLFEHDIEVQIALQQGLVEIPTTGSLKDFECAILINRKDVVHINEIIKKAGKKKLGAMRAACNFRRGIIFQEWEHQKVRMHIEDKEDELKIVESVKVIKELQEWLHKRQKGSLPGRGVLTLDREISRIRAGFERYIKALNEVVVDYEARIAKKKVANAKIDVAITSVNVEVSELHFGRDLEEEKIRRDGQRKRMELIQHRAKLVRSVQEIHMDVVALESEVESLRLRTYPILENANRKLKM